MRWLTTATAAFLILASTCNAASLRVCILSGAPLYRSDESLEGFEKFLRENYAVECRLLRRQANDDLPGLEALDDCDVALVYLKRMELKGDQLERFRRYMTAGKPIVAVRTASHAVQTWLDFDKAVLGGNYQSHFAEGPTIELTPTPAGQSHPILAGVQLPTALDALYKNVGHAPDIDVLLNGAIPGEQAQPVAWTREYRGGRIFYTSLGTPDTFALPAYRRMLAAALFWTARRDVEPQKP